MKKVCLSFIAMLVMAYILVCPVYGASHTFTLTVSPTSETANLGDTVSFDIGIADIDQSTDGISALEGMIKFESDLFESIDISSKSNWSVEINKNEGDPLKGKFVIARLGSTKETQVVATLYAKIRSDATVKSGTITLKDVFSSYADGATEPTTKTLTVNISSDTPDEGGDVDPTPDEGDLDPDKTTPDQTNPDNQEQDKQSNIPAPEQNAKEAAKTTNKVTSLPKAGIVASGIGIAVLAAIIVAIIELVKYKKAGK